MGSNNMRRDPTYSLAHVYRKFIMTGVPRSSGCSLCVKRRVKVRLVQLGSIVVAHSFNIPIV